MAKIKKYKVGLDSECYAISVVSQPAIEETLVALSKEEEKKQVFLEASEKHMIYGAVLVPDLDIYRYDGENEYFVTFSQESIEKLSQDYMKNFRQWEVTKDHKEAAPEVCLVETWLKADMEKDKSIALGLNPNLPVGTWFCGMKVNNIDLWEEIKSGSKGFSVESLVSLEEFTKEEKQNTNMEMSENFWMRLKDVFGEVLASFSMNERKNENLEVEPQPAPTVEPQPTQVEPQPTQVEPQPTQVEPQPQVDEPKVEEPQPKVEEPKAVEEPKPNPLEELVKSLQSELNELKTANAGLLDKVNELSKLPSAKPINTNAGNGGGDTYSSWREQMQRML